MLKACPIPGCGGAAVASPNKENARVVECSAQDCLTWLPVGLWQALPRASEAVLEVAREIKARLESNRIHPASQADLRDWIPRLESAAPGMGTPGEVPHRIQALAKIAAEQQGAIDRATDEEKEAWAEKLAADLAAAGETEYGTPQVPKAEAGECCICSGKPDTFACTECMDLATRANPAHLRSLERDADVLCTIRHRMGAANNDALLEMVDGPQPKADAGEVCDACFNGPCGAFYAQGCIHELQAETVIGAPSKGECDCDTQSFAEIQRVNLEKRDKALQRADFAERDRDSFKWQSERDYAVRTEALAERDTALADAGKARGDATNLGQLYKEAKAELSALRAQLVEVEKKHQPLSPRYDPISLKVECDTIRKQRDAAQRMVDEDNDRLMEVKREKDALRDQLGEAERAKDTMSEYITRIVGGKDALAERVRELEGEAVVYSRRAHQREGSLKGELHRAFTGWNKEAREFKSFRDSLASGDQMRIEYGPTGKAALRYDSTLYNAVPFDAPTPRAEALIEARAAYKRGGPGASLCAVGWLLDYLEAQERDS